MNEYEAYTVVTSQVHQTSACGIAYRAIGGASTEWETARKRSLRVGTNSIRATIKAIELAVESVPPGSKLSVHTLLDWLPEIINSRRIKNPNSDIYKSLYSSVEERQIELAVYLYNKDEIDPELRIKLDNLQERLRSMATETSRELQTC